MELRSRIGVWVPASLDLDAVVDNQDGALVFEKPTSQVRVWGKEKKEPPNKKKERNECQLANVSSSRVIAELSHLIFWFYYCYTNMLTTYVGGMPVYT